MHQVRIHLNHDEGVRWWAEDDLGFTGGSDDLEELLAMITEWAEDEGVAEFAVVMPDVQAEVAGL